MPAFIFAMRSCSSTVSTPSRSGRSNPFLCPFETITPYFFRIKVFNSFNLFRRSQDINGISKLAQFFLFNAVESRVLCCSAYCVFYNLFGYILTGRDRSSYAASSILRVFFIETNAPAFCFISGVSSAGGSITQRSLT